MGDENFSPTTNRSQLIARDEVNDERYGLLNLVDNVEAVKDQLSRYRTSEKSIYPYFSFRNQFLFFCISLFYTLFPEPDD